jgi:hypothetical protein
MEFLGKTVAGIMISDSTITIVFTDDSTAMITAVLRVVEKSAESLALDASQIALALHIDNGGTP